MQLDFWVYLNMLHDLAKNEYLVRGDGVMELLVTILNILPFFDHQKMA